MPELPEVETVRTGLARAIIDARIDRVTLRRENLRIPFPTDFVRKLTRRSITAIERRAKYLLFSLDSGDVILSHLGMSGRFLVENEMPKTLDTHDHVVWSLADGRVVIYNDPRRFGLMTLCTREELSIHPLLAGLGPEPLEREFSTSYLKSKLQTRQAPIKPVLMEQGLVVGVGNIYASEALFLAGIHPMRAASTVAGDAALLVKSIRKVLQDAIASGGSSLKDFMTVSGESGYFQHQFNVYDRAGEPCYRCKTPIMTLRQAGRSTFFCPKCQS